VTDVIEDTRVGLIGKTIGRYRVTAELGRGGMATVYRAHDPQLGRDVAIKVMHGAFAGRAELEARFRREARAVAGIKHDGIVNVFDFAPAAAGEPGYIVTEIVEGPTLRAVMDRHGGRLWPEVATLVAVRLASALGAAHTRGIVHRDVKPDNVMFDLSSPATARVLLTDFGIAHMTEGETMTATGAIVGSPIYMSPEQARGQDNIGPPSDVFSLGVLIYHVTTGRPPFNGRDPLTAIAAILRGEFLRPSQVDARVGPALEAVILRCMKTAPGERFPDGNALAAALADIAADVEKMLGSHDGDAGAALRRFFDDQAGGAGAGAGAAGAPGGSRPSFTAMVAPRVADQAYGQARHHARRGELARALSETNRAFAYAPDHAGARALLAGIARRRRAGKLAVAGLAAVALVAGGVAMVKRGRAVHG
jgi:serine/threonine-protein kinase